MVPHRLNKSLVSQAGKKSRLGHTSCLAIKRYQFADTTVHVKVSLAKSSQKLDLAGCGLTEIPSNVFELEDLEELSVVANAISSLPADVNRLQSLQKLGLAGNRLQQLPSDLAGLHGLKGLWAHGNLLQELPESLGLLPSVQQLSVAGNCLTQLPTTLGQLYELRELELAGNLLTQLPESVSCLSNLRKLTAHGNQLQALPNGICRLSSLGELTLMGNRLDALPADVAGLKSLAVLAVADNCLTSLTADLAGMPSLTDILAYGNRLTAVHPDALSAPALCAAWLEGNPLSRSAVEGLLAAAPDTCRLRALGLDPHQLQGVSPRLVEAAGHVVRVGHVVGEGPGYFKLQRAASGGAAPLVVVAFGSAPGVPNWAGLLKRVRSAARSPEESNFDVLYVVDPHRSWYGGGDGVVFEAYRSRLAAALAPYPRVLMLGDSMGASAALMFADLATAVLAFCPQVDLQRSAIRPGRDDAWLAALSQRVLSGVSRSSAAITACSGTWQHDLDQINLLPADVVSSRVFNVDSHRLAAALLASGRLLPLVRGTVLAQLGLPPDKAMRLHNLL